ncbi:cobalamin biosynthesis protein [Cognatishimia sp. F0-27]|uniref:cobalamin biosynthesis protein n=1 Tax=Cognatishimia sp. F0-27 TaxID=2816855 RepID=UPI001D0CD9EA|nr:cobalamin biosynthesis protein [Cognatishimia sp. F0-27]
MIVAGFGMRGAVTVDSLQDAYAQARRGRAVDLLAAPDDRARLAAFSAFGEAVARPVRGIDAAHLAAQTTQTQSPTVAERRGTGSVAEAAALAAAGPGARLIAARVISTDRMATCALAEGPDP